MLNFGVKFVFVEQFGTERVSLLDCIDIRSERGLLFKAVDSCFRLEELYEVVVCSGDDFFG